MSNYVNYYKQMSSNHKTNGQDSNNSFNLLKVKELDIPDDRKIIGPSLLNNFGDQNCFLNVLIHSAYNIKEIQKFFLEEEFRKDSRLNVYSEFQFIIEKYLKIMSRSYKSNDTTVDPSELRRELADLFQEELKFQLNNMNDPVDLFHFLLNSFHSYSTHAKSLKYEVDKPCNPQCLSHSVFWINLLEQFQCRCGATSEVLQYDYNYFMYEVYIIEILELADNKKDYIKSFFRILKENNSKTTLACPEKCMLNQVKRNFFLLSNPSYFCLNLIWNGKNPLLVDIFKLFTMLPLKFDNNELFYITDRNQSKTFELFGLVCYWGAHYICFFKNDNARTSWIYYDDTVVTKVDNWKEVIMKCLKSHFHPTILFYRLINEDPNSHFLRGKVDNSQVFSEEEFNKLLAYCKNIDSMNDKKSDYLVTKDDRKSLISSSKIKSSDSETIEIIKSLNKKNEEEIEEINENKSTSDNNKIHVNDKLGLYSKIDRNSNFHKESISLINKDLKKENQTQINKVEIKPAEDEWICQDENCRNVNKIDSYKCLKCKRINENIYLLNVQKNEYETNLKNSLKRRNSVDPRLMQGRSSIAKTENNFLFNSINKTNNQDNSYNTQNMSKNSSVIRREISPSTKQSQYSIIICNICNTKNSESNKKCRYCDNTLTDNKNQTASNFQSYSNLNDNYLFDKLNKNIRIDDNNQRVSNPVTNNIYKNQQFNNLNSNNLKQKEPWYCPSCRHLNKFIMNLCENCNRDKTIFKENKKLTNNSLLDYSLGMNTSDKYSTVNVKRGITPVKKVENIGIKESTLEMEKKKLNNQPSGQNPNIERIFNFNSNSNGINNYKPVINKDSNKKNINIVDAANIKPSNAMKSSQLRKSSYYSSDIFKKK